MKEFSRAQLPCAHDDSHQPTAPLPLSTMCRLLPPKYCCSRCCLLLVRSVKENAPCLTLSHLCRFENISWDGRALFFPHSPARDPQKQVINIMDQCWWCECLCSLTIMPKAARFQAQCHTFHQWLQKMLIEVTLLRLYFRQKWRYEIFHSYIWYNTYSPSF